MQVYSVKLLTKLYGGNVSRLNICLQFEIPCDCSQSMMDAYPLGRITIIRPDFAADYDHLESLKEGNYYNLIFDDDLQVRRALVSNQNMVINHH